MKMVDGVPRRIRVDLQTPAEAAIRAAIDAVENAGCHELLTEAVILLGQAREKVADFVERDEPTTETNARNIRIHWERGCFWHMDCEKVATGIMKVVRRQETQSLIECLSCGKKGYYPVGGAGAICTPEIAA